VGRRTLITLSSGAPIELHKELFGLINSEQRLSIKLQAYFPSFNTNTAPSIILSALKASFTENKYSNQLKGFEHIAEYLENLEGYFHPQYGGTPSEPYEIYYNNDKLAVKILNDFVDYLEHFLEKEGYKNFISKK